MNIVVVGLGGIGTYLMDTLCRFLNYREDLRPISIMLIDGDEFEDRNIERQTFSEIGNKAEMKMEELSNKFRNLSFEFIGEYIVEGPNMFAERDTVLCCVDNHATRKIVNDMCKELNNITLISAGNDYTDGNAQIYARRDGIDMFPSLTDIHAEIKHPEDRNPADLGCMEEVESAPQLIFANHAAGFCMCMIFYNMLDEEEFFKNKKGEIYFDIKTMAVSSKLRIPADNMGRLSAHL